MKIYAVTYQQIPDFIFRFWAYVYILIQTAEAHTDKFLISMEVCISDGLRKWIFLLGVFLHFLANFIVYFNC
jgi:uncharacterized membrane protein